MHIYSENFNLKSNYILTKCLKHLKIGREYDTELFLVKILSLLKGGSIFQAAGSIFVEEIMTGGLILW